MDRPHRTETRAVVIRLHAPWCSTRRLDAERDATRSLLERWRTRGVPVVAIADHHWSAALFDLRSLVAFHQDVRRDLGPCDALVIGNDNGPGCGCEHPDPQAFTAAARAAGTDAPSCLALLEAIPDRCAARAAGLTTTGVPS